MSRKPIYWCMGITRFSLAQSYQPTYVLSNLIHLNFADRDSSMKTWWLHRFDTLVSIDWDDHPKRSLSIMIALVCGPSFERKPGLQGKTALRGYLHDDGRASSYPTPISITATFPNEPPTHVPVGGFPNSTSHVTDALVRLCHVRLCRCRL